jgi:hypothetical protein
VNVFVMNKDGTLQLCHDPFYFEQPKPDKSVKTKDHAERERRRMLEEQHNKQRVIEVRNPNSNFPDLRLPITRSKDGNHIWDNDAQLVVRSASFVETNDPPELNFVRTGNDATPVNDENAPVADGSITGILRFMGRCSPAKGDHSGVGTDAEIIGRNYGTSEKDHRGGLFFFAKDNNIPNATDSSGVMAIVQPGVRIGRMARAPGEGKTGSIFEVDAEDDRPVIFRRSQASTTQPVMLALANGKNGTSADDSNSLALIKATPLSSSNALTSRIEIQTNTGNKLQSDWVLPVPAAQLSSSAAQQISSGELVALAFDQNRYDTDAIRQTDQPTRLTCRTAGRYAISAAVEFAANGKGSRQIIVRLNGQQQVAAMRAQAVDGETTQVTFTAPPIELKIGDYVELMVRQTSGQTLEVPAKGELPPTFAMTRVG